MSLQELQQTEERIVGIRHRRKKTREGEARPTTVAIVEGGKTTCYDLETETDELAFLTTRFPIDWELVGDVDVEWFDEDKAPNGMQPHQCKWKKLPKDDAAKCRQNHIRETLDSKGLPVTQQLVKIPTAFDGLKSGDLVAMVLGGSGDYLAGGLYNRGQEIGAWVHRLKPMDLKRERGDKSKDDDHQTLVELLGSKPKLFHQMGPKDLEIIETSQVFRLRQDAMKARVACQQRILQRLVGMTFLARGTYPVGEVKKRYDAEKANSATFKALEEEESRYEKDLRKLVDGLKVWQEVFEPIKGCGQRIAAPLIVAIGDIRQFVEPVHCNGQASDQERKKQTFKAINKTLARLKSKCGAHVLFGGKYGDNPRDRQFPRRRLGAVAPWDQEARQALFLLVDQFNRRPETEWGQKLLLQKAKYRQTHPEPVKAEVEVYDDAKKAKVKKTVTLYTDGHIHKMALKWCATKFVERFGREWLKLENVYQT